MRRHLAGADGLFMDETTAPVLDPGRSNVKKGFFWGVPKTVGPTAESALLLCHRCQKLEVNDGRLALVGIEQHGKIAIVAREIDSPSLPVRVLLLTSKRI